MGLIKTYFLGREGGKTVSRERLKTGNSRLSVFPANRWPQLFGQSHPMFPQPYFPLLFCALAFFSACVNSDKEINALNRKAVATDEAFNIKSYMSQGGKVKAYLTAPYMKRLQADTTFTEFPKSLHVEFYNDSTKVVETKLDARYGMYYETQGKVYLRDSVVIINFQRDKDTIVCKDLWWDQNKQTFYTDKKVVHKSLRLPLYVAENGVTATQDLKSIEYNESHGEVLINSGQIPK